MSETLYDKNRLKDIPTKPGIYIMKNDAGDIIYVGKAINLRNRVRSYFQDSRNLTVKTRALVSHIKDIETIVVENEVEALILECSLIKKNRPKYNINLKDGKTYPYIVITYSENYPRVLLTRERHKDENRYFGPYTNAFAVRKTIDTIHRNYPIRMCSKEVQEGKRVCRPCLNYHLGKCPAPCTGTIDQESYNKRISQIEQVLDGKAEPLIKKLDKEMKKASEKLDFETAAELRDQKLAVEHIAEKQRIIKQGGHDQDIIALEKDNDICCIQILNIRGGILVGRDSTFAEDIRDEDEKDILTAFTKQYYTSGAYIPPEIIFSQSNLDEKENLEKLLSEFGEQKVSFVFPKRGEKRALTSLAQENAQSALKQFKAIRLKQKENKEEKIKNLKNFLNLKENPKRIEAYDISHISGTNAVGGMVVFNEDKAEKKNYRRFKIKSVQGVDDYASIKEVLFRRLERGQEELKEGKKTGSFLPFPDIIAIDGGIGHVRAAQEILSLYPELNISVIGLVKDNHHQLRGVIYQDKEYALPTFKPLSKFLNEISEEVHRYSINYHKSLRKKSMLESKLETIKGVGKKRRQTLIRHFGNLKNLQEASVPEIAELPGISESIAKDIKEALSQ